MVKNKSNSAGRTFLEKQVIEVGKRLDKLGDIKFAIVMFFIFSLLFSVLITIAVIQQLMKNVSGIAKVMDIIDLIVLPAFLIMGIVSLKQINSLIRSTKHEYDIKKKELAAERKVQEFLKNSLTSEYRLFTNVYTGYGDVDAVVVGPSGVFAIEVKSNSGVVSQDSKNRLTIVDGDTPKKNYRRQAILNSKMIKHILDGKTGKRSFVSPILVFPFASVLKDIVLDSPNPADNFQVPVLSTNEIVEYIYTHRRYPLSHEQIEEYSKALEEIKAEHLYLDASD